MLTSVWLICIITPPPPPREGGGVVRAEFDPGSRNAIPAALRRQMTTNRGGGVAQNSTPDIELLLPKLYNEYYHYVPTRQI